MLVNNFPCLCFNKNHLSLVLSDLCFCAESEFYSLTSSPRVDVCVPLKGKADDENILNVN